MKIKKLLVLLLSVFILTGCTPLDRRTKIQFASWGSKSEVDILKPILADFEEENPDLKVEFVHIPQNYFQKIHLLFASDLAPDVIFVNNLYLPIYAKAGVLAKMSDFSDKNLRDSSVAQDEVISKEHLSKFYKKSLESLSYEGVLYAVPRDVSNLVIYYNKDLFKKYGVPAPSEFWSFDDFLILAQKLTKDTNGDGKTDIWGISFEDNLLFYLPYLMSEGGGVLSDDLKTSIINTPESKKGLQFYTDLRNKYHVAPTQADSASATMAQLFLQGKLAMHLSGRWLVPKYRSDAKFGWNVVNFPAGDNGSIVPLDASGWAVSQSSKHKPEAVRLINYLSSKKSIEKFSESGLIVPARKDVARGVFLNDNKLPRNNHVFIDVIKTAKITPVSVDYNQLQDELKEKTNYLFNSDEKVKDINLRD